MLSFSDPTDSLPELIERFGTEDKCHEYLEHLRWPEGVICLRCEGTTISRLKKRRQFECDGCKYQFSVRVGTVLHDSKLPLWKWFLATYLMLQSKKGISAIQMSRMLGVSYKTAWYLCHRIRWVMTDDEGLLDEIVEVDETWVGGKVRGGGRIGSQLSKKHLGAYLDELAFRYNNRNNPYMFRDIIKAIIESDTLRYQELVS